MWVLLLLLLWALPAWGAEFYVDGFNVGGHGCSPSNSGTDIDHPVCTIAQGRVLLNNAGGGNTLWIRAGNYGESIRVTKANPLPSGSSWATATVVAGYSGETVQISGGQGIDFPSQEPGNAAQEQLFQYIILKNFKIVGGGAGAGALGCGYSGLASRMECGAHFIRFDTIEVSNLGGVGFCPGGAFGNGYGATDLEYLNVTAHDGGGTSCPGGQPNGHGFYTNAERTLIDNAHVYNMTGYGLQIYDTGCPHTVDGSGNPIYDCGKDSVIRNSRFHHNGSGGWGGVVIGHASGMQVYNNLIYENNVNNLELAYASTRNTQVYNNTIYNSANGSGLHIANLASNSIIKNNIIINSRTPIQDGTSAPSVGTVFSNNLCNSANAGCAIVATPAFTNAGGGDFTLLSGSRGINEGVALTLRNPDGSVYGPVDKAGAARNQGGAWDIGAYEFNEGGPPPPVCPGDPSCPIVCPGDPSCPAPGVKAFPTAEGFGAVDTVGGRGGVVIQVINLNDSGAGSFRACAEGTGARTCVFRVSGMINLASPIYIQEANSFLTIAGQTAPSPGVTIGPWAISIQNGAHDVIIRHLRHRQAFGEWVGNPSAPPNQQDDCGAFTIYGPNKVFGDPGYPGSWHTHHIILDHVSVGYTCDDSMQMSGHVTDSTIQWALLADPYEQAKGDPYGASKGFIFGTNTPAVAPLASGTVHHSAFLQSNTRNPGGGPQGIMDWRYNLIYNWSACTGGMRIGGTDGNVPGPLVSNHNFVGNRYLAGPDTQPVFDGSGCWLGELRTEGNAKVYVQDNETPFCGGASCPANTFALGWGNGTTQSYPAAAATFQVGSPFSAPAVTATSRSTLESVLAANVGATVPLRDALDTRVISEMSARTGNVGRQGAAFPTLSSGGTPPTDTDADGMPDAWETAHGLNPNLASDRNLVATNGYTNLENYLNELAGDALPTAPPPTCPPTCAPPTGNPIYVAQSGGSPANDCLAAENPSTPKATIADGLACMGTVPGKIMYIKTGTYTDCLDTGTQAIKGGNGPSYADATIIASYGTDLVTIRPTTCPLGAVAFFRNGATDSYIVIRGSSTNRLVFDGTLLQNNVVLYPSTHHIRFEFVEVQNTANFEAFYGLGAANIALVDSLVHGAVTSGIAMDDGSSTWTIERTTVSSNGGVGVNQKSGTISGLTIKESTIRDNTSTGVRIGTSTGVTMLNSLVYDNASMGTLLLTGATGVKLYNNNFYSNTGVGVQCDSGAASVELTNNILFGNGTNLSNSCSATLTTNYTSDPLFVSPPSNQALQNGSGAINAGTTLASVTIAVDGTARPVGTNYDIGAYERTQAAMPGVDVTTQTFALSSSMMFF